MTPASGVTVVTRIELTACGRGMEPGHSKSAACVCVCVGGSGPASNIVDDRRHTASIYARCTTDGVL